MAWLCGLVAASLPKGQKWHRFFGKCFVSLMLFSAAVSLIVANLPNHKSPFLTAIGIFTIYLTTGGFLAWNGYKGTQIREKILAFAMFITGIGMVGIPYLLHGKINIVMLAFGSVGILLSVMDFRLIRNPEKLKGKRIFMHIGKMTGALISATTAFVVVNGFLPGLWGWFLPSILGIIYIFYQNKKHA